MAKGLNRAMTAGKKHGCWCVCPARLLSFVLLYFLFRKRRGEGRQQKALVPYSKFLHRELASWLPTKVECKCSRLTAHVQYRHIPGTFVFFFLFVIDKISFRRQQSSQTSASLHVSSFDSHIAEPSQASMMLQTVSTCKRKIQDGDIVIVYESYSSSKAVEVKSLGQFQNAYGIFLMKDWIGKPYGSKVANKLKTAWVHLLAPTPELWTLVLRHRTQILYLADIAMICARLELRPGAIVLESGTGSGSLTHSLARSVAPHGKVYTFDFHEQRVEEARNEFHSNGISDVVSIAHRNIEQDGFPQDLHGRADAVFLDLPGPWHVVPSASLCLRPDGVFCGFSPCIEQVQNTTERLNACGFKDIHTCEILLREFEVVPRDRYLQKRSVRDMLEAQTRNLREERENKGIERDTQDHHGESKEERAPVRGSYEATMSGQKDSDERKKRRREDGDGHMQVDAADITATKDYVVVREDGAKEKAIEDPQDRSGQLMSTGGRAVVARPVRESKGHTGFLTFARKIVPL